MFTNTNNQEARASKHLQKANTLSDSGQDQTPKQIDRTANKMSFDITTPSMQFKKQLYQESDQLSEGKPGDPNKNGNDGSNDHDNDKALPGQNAILN